MNAIWNRSSFFPRAIGSPQKISCALLLLGIVLRAGPYLRNYSLEVSEASLSLNILHRSYDQLRQPLDRNQAAPLGFLWAEKAVTQYLGPSEYALRLLPLLCGILSLFLFSSIAAETLGVVGWLTSLGLFAVSKYLIFYSFQVKQYIVDVACALFLVRTALWARGQVVRAKQATLLALAGAIAIWFSHPSVFVLGSIGAFLLWHFWSKDRQAIRWLICVGIVWAIVFASSYFLTLQGLNGNNYLTTFWKSGFMPLPPKSPNDLRWFLNTFFEVFDNPGGLSGATVASFPFLVGLITLFSRERFTLALWTGPLILALAASGIHRFPFRERLILFIVPTLIILISLGVEKIRASMGVSARWIASLLVGFLILNPLLSAVLMFSNVPRPEESRPAVMYLKTRWVSGDELFVFCNARAAYEYYAERLGLEQIRYQPGTNCGDPSLAAVRNDVDQLLGRKRVWVLFSHMVGVRRPDINYYLFLLNRSGKQMESFKAPGSELYLFDLSTISSLTDVR